MEARVPAPRAHASVKLSASAGPSASSALSTSAPAHPSTSGGGARPRSGSSRPPNTGFSRAKKSEQDQVRIVGEHYQLGAEIGRGGFGVVFAALDLRNGRSLAIKQVSLHDIDKDELLSIESEISLLKKLNHENIVKYHDTIRTQTYLYIVLEYMENGSLAQFMKKFGSFSETLVAMYITQVLRGLAYLHEQGVLHRDVKGANILTTKDGLVKLADFGVAIKLSETQKSNSVVGSPYWMAPEVIEMAGWSFASDIWSVGCTIIELLSTKPPYFDLAPMAALFRIVQDDHPPLPERISPALHDFIMKCFMKEPRLRGSAEELLTHPWIAQIPKNKVEQSSQMVSEHVSSLNDRDAVLNTIKKYEKEKHTSSSFVEASPGDQNELVKEEDDDAENWDDEFGVESTPKPMSLVPVGSQERPKNKMDEPVSALKKVFQLSKEDENALFDDELWEDDDGNTAEDEKLRAQNTLKPPRSGSTIQKANPIKSEIVPDADIPGSTTSWDRSSLVPKEKRLTKLQSFSEKTEEGDLGFEDFDEEQLIQAVARKKTMSIADKSVEGKTTSVNFNRFNDDDDDDSGFDDMVDSTFPQDFPHRLSKRDMLSARDASESLPDYLFDDEMDFEYSSIRDNNQKATSRVVELLALLDPSMDDQVILDACTSLQEIFESNQALRRDLMSQPGVVPNIMEALEMKKMDVLYAVLKVINMIVEDNQKFQENLALVGLVPVIIKLTKQDYSSALFSEEHLSMDSTSAQNFAAFVRLEAAKFVRQSCKTSSLTLQMFIACGGLPVLVDFLTLDNDIPTTNSEIDLLRIALEGIFSVFNLQTIPKNDICRLFVKAGLLKKFIVVFNEIVKSVCAPDAIEEVGNDFAGRNIDITADRSRSIQRRPKKWTMDELHKTCDIFMLFSQGDAVVKEHVCDGLVLEGLLQALHRRVLPSAKESPAHQASIQKVRQSDEFVSAMVKVLKCIRNLSMEPITLEKLDRAGTIPTLVHLLNEQEAEISTKTSHGSKRKEVENIVLQSMFYLCRINRNRQTHAAQAGVIPSLMKVIKNASPLKQFALPILCDLAHASPTARAHLWACDGVSLFLEMLDDKYWQMDAIKSISIWLVHDTVKVEDVLLIPKNLMKLMMCFRSAQDTELENLLEPLIEMTNRSVRLNQSLGRSAMFVTEILKRLQLVPKAIVRKNLLKMLKSLFESHTSPTQFLVEYNLHPIIYALAQDENNMILVKEIASQLLQAILVAAAVF
uniref:non-specific serine/threonine protein kinase n=1 Tax=Globisporangium ultimum (strain ATCC 200006 / CBS 805.95 / DAOM BR144) TaxID=431595 RepID=K3X170_GLOUD